MHQRFLRLESLNLSLESRLGFERHGGCTGRGVCSRALHRLLTLTAALRHDETGDRPGPARSLIACDH